MHNDDTGFPPHHPRDTVAKDNCDEGRDTLDNLNDLYYALPLGIVCEDWLAPTAERHQDQSYLTFPVDAVCLLTHTLIPEITSGIMVDALC